MTVLSKKIETVLPTCVDRAIIATAIMSEKGKWPEVDNRPEDVKKFEQELRNLGASPADAAIVEKALGIKVSVRPTSYGRITPQFLGTLVAVRPYDYENETTPEGIPFDVPIIFTNSKTPKVRWDNKEVSGYPFHTNFYRPATEEEVKTAVETLFAARPALTLKLFGIKFDNEVQAVDGGQED